MKTRVVPAVVGAVGAQYSLTMVGAARSRSEERKHRTAEVMVLLRTERNYTEEGAVHLSLEALHKWQLFTDQDVATQPMMIAIIIIVSTRIVILILAMTYDL